MARRHPILRGLVTLGAITLGLAVLAVGLAVLVGEGDRGGLADRLPFGRSVGVVEVRGVIDDPGDVVEALERFRRQDGTVAVVVRVESPGGAVAPAQEIYDAIWRVRERKPVVASLGNVAASAGYYVASAANVIVSSPGTLTGSVGVIMQLPYYGPLAEKVGVSEQVVKSGEFKDIGHPLRTLRPEERALLQTMIDDVLGQFVDAVARGRGMEPERVRALADGRVFTGAQARAAGLVDRFGGLEDATRLAWEQAGQTGEPRVTRVRVRRRPWWLDLLTGAVSQSAGVVDGGGFLSVYRGPLAR
jgi:protease-4